MAAGWMHGRASSTPWYHATFCSSTRKISPTHSLIWLAAQTFSSRIRAEASAEKRRRKMCTPGRNWAYYLRGPGAPENAVRSAATTDTHRPDGPPAKELLISWRNGCGSNQPTKTRSFRPRLDSDGNRFPLWANSGNTVRLLCRAYHDTDVPTKNRTCCGTAFSIDRVSHCPNETRRTAKTKRKMIRSVEAYGVVDDVPVNGWRCTAYP